MPTRRDPPRRATGALRDACRRKRRYASQGDALDAALLAGVERQRHAYRCAVCGHWHLTTTGS
jgi:hypothetical protein